MLRQLFNGICMALADSVPGVSGGTIAFILGFYDRFIGSINDVVFEKGKKRKEAFIYLAKLGVGWVIGFVGAVLVLSNVFESHIYAVSSLFVGFILASIPLVIKEEKEAFRRCGSNIIFMLLGIVVVVGITLLNHTSLLSGVRMDHLSIPLMVYVFFAGMIAICAMFLPGISGSTLLLIFGLYMPIITGIKELLYMNLAYFPGLFIFGLGVLTGAASVVKGIKICLERYRSQMLYAILGLMIGSLYAIVMGPATLPEPAPALSVGNFNLITAAAGMAVVLLLDKVVN